MTEPARGRKLRLGVLCSGSGSNLQAILDAVRDGRLDAEVSLVVANRDAYALERAQARGVPTRLLSHKGHASREAYDATLVAALREAEVDLVVLAGFMRIVTDVLLTAFPDRVVNLHPALLPAFPGVDGMGQALRYGATITGCTVHLVDGGVDTGPILAQTAVAIREDETAASLAERVHREEHALLVRVLGWFAARKVSVVRAEGARPLVRVPGERRAFFAREE